MDKLSERLKAELARLGIDPNGIAEIEITPVFECETCRDMGLVSYNVPVGNSRFGQLFPCDNPGCKAGQRQRAITYQNRYKTARIPELYAGFTFDSWRDSLTPDEQAGKILGYMATYLFAVSPGHYVTRQEIYEAAGMNWDGVGTNRPKNSLMLFGRVGTGKTGLTGAAVNWLLDNGESVLYTRAVDLIESVKARFGAESAPTAEDVIRDFATAPVLWLDEFNLALDTDYRKEVMETILRARYANRLPTLMTANLNQDQFIKQWGERTSEAVLAMCHWIEVGGLKIRETEKPLSE